MTDQPNPPARSDEHRAVIVAGLRAMADFVEQHTDIPAPGYLVEQHSVLDGTDAEKIAIVRHVAEALGVAACITKTAAWCVYEVAERTTYRIQALLTGGGAA